MTLAEYFEYIKNPLAEAKMRVVTMPPGESWTTLRRFCQERGDVEVRLSDLINESAWLPMPAEVFERVRNAMTAKAESGKSVMLLGLPGYLALLTDENKRAAVAALREWVDSGSGRAAVCLLRCDEVTNIILKDVFANPRYCQGKQLIEIDAEHCVPQFAAGRTEVMLVGADLASFIPEACDTFQKYLRYTEEHPNDNSVRRIVVASQGQELAGVSAEVRQVLCLRDVASVFYDVDDVELSEDALRWLCGWGKDGAGKTMLETLKALLFPHGEITKRVLRVFDARQGVEREAVLWLVKHLASNGSYLKRVVGQEGVTVDNFRSAYVMCDADWLDDRAGYAVERRDAIQEAKITMSSADIKQFIERCSSESTSRVAPWLNCGTVAERAELLRRCAADGVVSNAVKAVYPEVAAYLNTDPVFNEEVLEEYFKEYRNLKMTGCVTPEFYKKVENLVPPSSLQSRDQMVQQHAADIRCALLVVDAMGAEWMPMLVTMAKEWNISVDSLAVGKACLPTSTQYNNIYWPDTERRLPDIKCLDNIAHNGAETHETHRAEENLAAALDVIGGEVLPRVADGLARFEQVLVTADHGSSRLAMLAWQSEPKLAKTLVCDEGANVSDWRYCKRASQGKCPSELEETLDGRYWVVRSYDRLSKQGGGQGFELHGGATLEERLVPVIVFSRAGQLVRKPENGVRRAQIIENDDFDL